MPPTVAASSFKPESRRSNVGIALILLTFFAGVAVIFFLGWNSGHGNPDAMLPESQAANDAPGLEAYRPVLRASELAWKAKIEAYRPVVGGSKHVLEGLHDGRTSRPGIVVDLWAADTRANTDACRDDHADQLDAALCGTLKTRKIVAVFLHGIKGPVVAFVPVSRTAQISQGDDVSVILGKAASDGSMHVLPRLTLTEPSPDATPRWEGRTP